MPGVKLTTQAYCKMVLHGAKYPHCAVNGLLVAEKQKPRKEHLPLGGPGAHHTLFVDCIPLFHGTLALAPMLEVALTLIDSWCKDNSYVIAGYYQANERVKDASPNQVAEKVASRIAEGFSDTALIMPSGHYGEQKAQSRVTCRPRPQPLSVMKSRSRCTDTQQELEFLGKAIPPVGTPMGSFVGRIEAGVQRSIPGGPFT
uniref:ER membrane protein complex subunit 8 n=1 Tax=Sus scrofa TaxID=9823 RepID=A0A8D1QU20_PIG